MGNFKMASLAGGMTYPYFTLSQAEKNPHFVELLKNLMSNKLGRNLITKTKEEDLNQVFKEFSENQKEYETKKVSDALISAELGQSLKLSELDCKKESNLFGTEIKSRLLEDNDVGWLREQIKRKLIHQGVE